MARLFRRAHRKAGQAPGTLEYTGERKVERVRMRVIDYDAEQIDERELTSVEDCFPYREPPRVSWLNIDGLHEVPILEQLGTHFGIHPLVLEDIVSTHQRPKTDEYEGYLYVVMRMVGFDEKRHEISMEQISLILGPSYVLTFQEREGDVFEPVRERLRRGKGRARKLGPDYLAYALMDAVVDHYFVVLERIGDRIEQLEQALIEEPTQEQLQAIHRLKREMILLRKSIWPLREVVGGLERSESELFQEGTDLFLRDVYDHTIQAVDAVESFRDILSGLQDLYLSSISNKMNEVMKVLTIIGTIFIPLSFLAGLYGMNFDFMPELHWKWSYPIFWVVILVAAGGMLAFFRRKRWL